MMYALIMGRTESGSPAMHTLNVDGERALPVFESVAAADDFRVLGGLGPQWSVVDDPDGTLPELLRVFVAPHVRYVTIDPPAATKGGPAPAVALIPIERFLENA